MKTIKELIAKIKDNENLKVSITSSFSLVINLVFIVYNLYLGTSLGNGWNYAISIYYTLFLIIRSGTGIYEIRGIKSTDDQISKKYKRRNLYLIESILVMLIDLALVMPITLMIREDRMINYSSIAAIAIAAYTAYKIIIATRNFIKSRKNDNLSIKMMRNLSFIDALVSILTLQYTLIMTFGSGIDRNLLPICATVSFVIYGLILVISTVLLVHSIKLFKNRRNEEMSERNIIKEGFESMKQSAREQSKIDKANFEAEKANAKANFEENRGKNTFRKAKQNAHESWERAKLNPEEKERERSEKRARELEAANKRKSDAENRLLKAKGIEVIEEKTEEE